MGSAGGRTSSPPRLKNGPWTGELALWLWHKREVTSEEEKREEAVLISHGVPAGACREVSLDPACHVRDLLSSAFYIVRLLTVLWGVGSQMRNSEAVGEFTSLFHLTEQAFSVASRKPGAVADAPILDNTIFSIIIQPAFLRKNDIFCSQS